MARTKIVLGVVVALAVALLAGWIWGRSDRSDLARALETSELREELLAAQAATLEARLAIYSVNFGEASGHLEEARAQLDRAGKRLATLGRVDETTQVQAAQARIDEAQRMAGDMNQDAKRCSGASSSVERAPRPPRNAN